MLSCLCRAGLAVGFLAAAAGAQESLPVATMSAIKDATVLIKVTGGANDGASSSSGSGFLIRVDGREGYLVTNHHVVGPEEGESGPRAVRAVFRAGGRSERAVEAQVVADSAERDLAVLRVSGVPDLPRPIDLREEPELVETMPVYVFGFPFGESLVEGKGRVSVVVGRGSVSSVRRDDAGEPKAVLIDGALNPGNSGGPVVDARGRLVGVAVATIQGAHIGIAIPTADLRALLVGRAEGLELAVRSARNGVAELAVAVPLVAPLGGVKSAALRYAPAGPATGAKGGSARPDFPGGSKLAALNVEPGRATGLLSLPVKAGEDLELVYQVELVDDRDRTICSKSGRYLLAVPRGSEAKAAGRPALVSWGDVVDPDGDCRVRPEGGGVALEVPGTHHDLNTDPARYNAPRLLREVEGDFVVRVKVTGNFRPEPPCTRHGGFPFNGAGLVVWRDAQNFLRMERGAVSRNGQVGTFLLFEDRQRGRLKGQHNGFVEPGDVYLKIERRGRKLTGFYGTDGQSWAEAAPIEVDWPARLKVGVEAVSSSFAPFAVRFEEFSVEPPAADRPE